MSENFLPGVLAIADNSKCYGLSLLGKALGRTIPNTAPYGLSRKRTAKFVASLLSEKDTAMSFARRFPYSPRLCIYVTRDLTVNNSPIHSYGGQATLKPNLPEPEQHAMIYTSPNPPEEHCLYDSDGKVVAREALSKDPIRVRQELNDEQGDLGCFSRINYAKIYTVEKYVRILNIGKVHEDSMDSLIASCFFARPEDQPPKGPRRPSSSSKPKEGRERKEDKGSSSRHHRKHK